MPISKLDDVAALVVIDLQKGIMAMPTAHPSADIVARSAALARAFRKRGLPVVLVNVSPGAPGRVDQPRPKMEFPPDWTDIVPELEAAASDIRVTKRSWGGFLGTGLDEALRKRGVTQVFFAGISTSVGVESTARGAYDLGYNVAMITDAMTDRDGECHRHSQTKIFPRMSESGATEEVLKLLSA